LLNIVALAFAFFALRKLYHTIPRQQKQTYQFGKLFSQVIFLFYCTLELPKTNHTKSPLPKIILT